MLLQNDRDYIAAALEELDAFLKSDQVHQALPGPAGLPRLSLGALLVAQSRLAAAGMSGGEALLEPLTAGLQARAALVAHKAARELPGRLGEWAALINDLDERDISPAEYAARVRLRVMLARLTDQIRFPEPAWGRRLEELDRRLQRLTRPAAFVWEDALEGGFPPEPFWYLYRGW